MARPYIIVTGGDGGWGNLGDELLLQATRRFWRPFLDRFHIVVAMGNPPASLADGFTYVKEDISAIEALGIEVPQIALLHYYGGGYFNDHWYDTKIKLYRDLVGRGLPRERVAFTGQGLGPLAAERAQEMLDIAHDAIIFGTRDRTSAAGEHGLFTFDDSVLLCDPARALQPSVRNRGIAVNLRTEEYVDLDEQGAADLLCSIDRYVGSRNLAASAFGMVCNAGYDESVAVSRALQRARAKTIVHAPRPSGFSELAGYLAPCRAAVTTSYHVAIVSLFVGTPVAALFSSDYYRLKFAGLAEVVSSPLLRIVPVEGFKVGILDELSNMASRDEYAGELVATLDRLKAANREAHELIGGVLA
jgi:polysaccharide pyruvyl transferase WcaK-like protein